MPCQALETQDYIKPSVLRCQRTVGAFAGFDGHHVISGSLTCKSWSCPACQPKLKADLFRRVFNGGVVMDSTSRYGLKFLTLTGGGADWRSTFAVYSPQGTFLYYDHVKQYEVMSANFSKLMKALKKHYGHFYYFRVCELHLDGTPHFHVLFAGNNIVPKSILNSIESLWCGLYGMGFVKLNTPKRADGQKKCFKDAGHAVSYMLKYITKGHKSVGRYKRIFTASKGALLRREKKEWKMLMCEMGSVDDDGIKTFKFEVSDDGFIDIGGGRHRPWEGVVDQMLKIEMEKLLFNGMKGVK